jgi:hypothetical protein
MNVVRTDSESATSSDEVSARLGVALVYEDFATGARARNALEWLCGGQELGVDLCLDVWRFDLLRDPEIASQVFERTGGADIVVVSMHGKSDLPGQVLVWLDRWLKAGREGPAALVVSLDEAAREDPGVRGRVSSLQSVAGAAGVDVFVHFGSGTSSREAAVTVEDLNNRFTARTELLDEMLNRTRGYRDWGINE